MSRMRSRNPGAHPAAESADASSAYADLPAPAPMSDIDWYASDVDYIAEQTPGGCYSF